ncbi:hypothetical protein J5X07_11435, partial [Actinomyces bowdenii]|uniref:hypothetical protein n=1 Tax=Actinomyces bowdenii TaxID=131109 RepID=UPI001ABD0AEE
AGKPKTKQTQQQPHNKKAAEPSSSPHGIKNMTHYRDLKQHTQQALTAPSSGPLALASNRENSRGYRLIRQLPGR